MTRRDVLTVATTALGAASALGAENPAAGRMGLVIHSYWKRWRGHYSSVKYPPFQDALDVLDHVRAVGAAALQIGVEGWSAEFAGKVRGSCEAGGIALEGSIRLPESEGDSGRFDRELRIAKEAGATVFRSAMGGRRYEVFAQRPEFEQWKARALRSIQLAEPIARRAGVRIGIENHKDFECWELVEILRKLGSAHIGACIDTGNSLALLEDPAAVVTALAPFAVTTHIKDMAVKAADDGFLLSEVPLGEGFLDLAALVSVIRAANPEVRFHLEMITRDPLVIPCLSEAYWASFPAKPGVDLARALSLVRAHEARELPRTTGLTDDDQLALEEQNIKKSLAFAAGRLPI